MTEVQYLDREIKEVSQISFITFSIFNNKAKTLNIKHQVDSIFSGL